MRILFVSVSAGLGGAERVLLDAVDSLGSSRPGWAVGAVCLADGPLIGELRRRGAEIQLLPLPRRFAAVGEFGSSAAATLAGVAASAWSLRAHTRRLRALAASWAPDVVHANGLKAHVLAAWTAPRSARVVWHLHDYIGTRRVSSALLRRHAGRVSVILANSASVAADARSVLRGRARVEVLQNGIDTSRFRPDGPALDLDAAAGVAAAPTGTVRVGLVATYARWKGHEIFLDALGRTRDLPVTGYVVGGPVYETSRSQFTRVELEARARELGLAERARFVPFQQDVAPVLRSLDVVVHASTRPEPFGLTVLEAMGCGRAVVAAGAGGVQEIVDAGATGLLHRPGDADDLAGQVRRLVTDPGLRAQLGRAAAVAAGTRFGRDRFGAALCAVYEGLRAAGAVPRPT